jgi:hypothetical protein
VRCGVEGIIEVVVVGIEEIWRRECLTGIIEPIEDYRDERRPRQSGEGLGYERIRSVQAQG